MDIASTATTGKDAGSINPLQLLNVIRSAGGALFAQANLHAQLASIEWQEEKQRIRQLMVFSLLAFAFFLCFLFITSAFAIAISWYTPYRIHVFISLIAAYFLLFIWAALRVKTFAELSSKSFAATRAEIAADIALLKNVL